MTFNKATLASVTFPDAQPAPNYSFGGAVTLVDGVKGGENFSTGAWLGFLTDEVSVLIDLEQPTDFNRLSVSAMTYLDAWIMGLTGLRVAVSDDGVNYKEICSNSFPVDTDIRKRGIEEYTVELEPTTARYVKIMVTGSGALPKGHAGEGKKPYLFMDEIALN